MSYGDGIELTELVGKKFSVEINQDKDIVRFNTDNGFYYLTFVGDCCTQAFLGSVDGSDVLDAAGVYSIEHLGYVRGDSDENDHDVMDEYGVKIKTTKGRCNLEARAVHNGYYGGWATLARKPLDQYSSEIDLSEHEFTPLKDF